MNFCYFWFSDVLLGGGVVVGQHGGVFAGEFLRGAQFELFAPAGAVGVEATIMYAMFVAERPPRWRPLGKPCCILLSRAIWKLGRWTFCVWMRLVPSLAGNLQGKPECQRRV